VEWGILAARSKKKKRGHINYGNLRWEWTMVFGLDLVGYGQWFGLDLVGHLYSRGLKREG
jgi:hypothetical protein